MSKRTPDSPSIKATREVLLSVLDCAFDRRGWQGPNLMSATRGVSAKQASRKVHGRRCIWEQVLHAAYWKNRALSQLAGQRKLPRKGSNWLPLPEQRSESAWKADLALLRSVQRDLREVVASLPAKRLADRKVVWLVHGAAAHDIYHTGQIRLVRRLLK